MPSEVDSGNVSVSINEDNGGRNQFVKEDGGLETILKKAEYIGSFLVNGSVHYERAEVVRQKLEAARAYTQSKPILLVISLHGIKVCDESGGSVHMAHALRRISYATCDPDYLQFAFLAREPKAQPNIQYCHAFVTKTAQEAENLNNIVGEAFRLAYAQQRLLSESKRVGAQTQTPTDSPTHPTQVASSSTGSTSHLHNSVAVALIQSDADVSNTAAFSKPEKIGYTLDSGLSSSESASRATKFQPVTPVSSSGEKPSPPVPPVRTVALTFQHNLPPASPDDIAHDQHQRRVRRETDSPHDTETPTPRSVEIAAKVVAPPRRPKVSRHQRGRAPHNRSHRHRSSFQEDNMDENEEYVDDNMEESAKNILTQSNEAIRRLQTSMDTVPSAPHPSPMPTHHHEYHMGPPPPPPHIHNSVSSRKFGEAEDHELADSLAAIPSFSSRRSTPFSPSLSVNAYDHATPEYSEASPRHELRSTAGLITRHGGDHSSDSSGFSTNAAHCLSSSSGGSDGEGLKNNKQQRNSVAVLVAKRHSLVTAMAMDQAQMATAPWYQPNIPREVALDMLARQQPGSFIVRDSGTHANCFALSVRVGETLDGPTSSDAGGQRCVSVSGIAVRGLPSSASPSHSAVRGINHYLIQRMPVSGGVRLKGLEKEWPSLSNLILHLTVMPEMLACPLRLPLSTSNPAFSDNNNQHHSDDSRYHHQPHQPSVPPHLEQVPCLSSVPLVDGSRFRPISASTDQQTRQQLQQHPSTQPLTIVDEDYQRLSDFSSILADLHARPKRQSTAAARSRHLVN